MEDLQKKMKNLSALIILLILILGAAIILLMYLAF